MQTRFTLLVSAAALLSFGFTASALAQRTGQSMSIQYGTVTGSQQIDLSSGAVPGGAVVGGTLGLISGSGRSSSRQARNAVLGAAAGAAVAHGAQGSTRGMLYDVALQPGGTMQIVSDQREIQKGDCVAVEKAGQTANIRRVSADYCDSANQAAVNAVAGNAAIDAQECLDAKQQLVEAQTTQAADLAGKKVSLLCND
jgi:hypothetical protein